MAGVYRDVGSIMLGDKSNVGGYALNGGSTKAGLVGCREVLLGQGRGMVS